MPSGSNRAEYDALARGVRYRVLYEQAFFDDDHAVDNVIEGVRAGEIARSVPHLPLRLAVADRAIAICPLVPGGPQGSPASPPRPWSARAVFSRHSPRSSNATGRQRSPGRQCRRHPRRRRRRTSGRPALRHRPPHPLPAGGGDSGQGHRQSDGAQPAHHPASHPANDDPRRGHDPHATRLAGGPPRLALNGPATVPRRPGAVSAPGRTSADGARPAIPDKGAERGRVHAGVDNVGTEIVDPAGADPDPGFPVPVHPRVGGDHDAGSFASFGSGDSPPVTGCSSWPVSARVGERCDL